MSETQTSQNNPSNPQDSPKPVRVLGGREAKPTIGLISAEQLSKAERDILEKKFGYDGETPVPSDLADRLGQDLLDPKVTEAERQAALASAVREVAGQMPEGFKPPEKDLEIPPVQELSDELLAEAVKKFTDAMDKSAEKSAAPAPASPASEAFKKALQEGIEDVRRQHQDGNLHPDILQATHQLESGNLETVDTEDAPSPSRRQADGHIPKERKEEIRNNRLKKAMEETTEEERDNYRTALCTMSRYQRSYDVAGGAITVTFRDTGADEDEMVLSQMSLDRHKYRLSAQDLPQLIAAGRRYEFAASLLRVRVNETGVCPIEVPERLSLAKFLKTLDRDNLDLMGFDPDDTDLRVWYRFIVSTALDSSIRAVLIRKYAEFEQSLEHLRILGCEPDFTMPTR